MKTQTLIHPTQADFGKWNNVQYNQTVRVLSPSSGFGSSMFSVSSAGNSDFRPLPVFGRKQDHRLGPREVETTKRVDTTASQVRFATVPWQSGSWDVTRKLWQIGRRRWR